MQPGRHRLRRTARVALGIMILGTVLGMGAKPADAHSPHDNIIDVDISPGYHDDGMVIAISREHLMKSTDRGETWTRLVRGLDNKHQLSNVEISADPDIAYVSSRGDGVYRSSNAGATWSRVNTGLGGSLNISMLEVSPHSPDVVYAATLGGGFFVTTTGGETWTRIEDVTKPTALSFAPDDDSIVVVGDADGAVFVSDDSGGTWEATAVEGRHGRISELAVPSDDEADRTFFAGTTTGGLVRSTDGGETFTRIDDDLADLRVMSVGVSPTYDADSTVWVSTWSEGVFESTDGGDSWSRRDDGLTKNEQADLIDYPHFGDLAVSPAADDPSGTALFLAAYDGLFRSSDRGAHWEELQTQLATNIQAVAFSPDYANDSTIAVVTYLNGIFISTDGGNTFEARNTGTAHRWAWLLRPEYVARMSGLAFSPTFADDDLVFSNARGYWFISDDVGAHWEASTPEGTVVGGAFGTDYMLIVFSPSFERDRTVVLGTEGGNVLRSEDGGRDFSVVSTLEHEVSSLVISPTFATDRTIFAGTPEGAFKSTDAGDSWSPVGSDLPVPVTSLAISTDFGTDGTVFAGTANGLFRSGDGGSTWNVVAVADAGVDGFVESVVASPSFSDDRMLFVSVKGRGLYKSQDGGSTFAPIAPDLIDDGHMITNWYHPTSEPIVFSPRFSEDQTILAISGSVLLESNDAGESWAPLDIPVTRHELTEESAPNKLLAVPGAGGANDDHGDHAGGGTASDRGNDRKTGIEARLDDISRREFAVSAISAVVAFALVLLVPLRSLSLAWKWLLRLAAAGVVFTVVLLVQQIG